MRSLVVAGIVAAGIAAVAVTVNAQAPAGPPKWETLVRQPLAADSDPVISVNGLTMPAAPVAEHSHPGSTIGYIADGQIENQVLPDPPAMFTAGGHFYEAPRQVHKMMRNVGAQPAKLLIFHAGRTGVPPTLLKPLPAEPITLSFAAPATQWQVPLTTTAKQELRLVRVTLPAGARSEAPVHTGPGMVYVLKGTVTLVGTGPKPITYTEGDLFLDPARREGLIYRNLTGTNTATLLMFYASDPQAPLQNPPMMPYTAVHKPSFVPAAKAPFALDDDLVIGVVRGSTAKAYMALDLGQHGSVDDVMPDGPIEVTWCSTCGTGAVFRSTLDGRTLHFEYDSMVNANEVHRDVETGSRWQQSTGEAISGPLKGRTLTLYPFILTTWKAWRARFPNTTIMKPEPGYEERVAILRPRMKLNRTSGEGAAPDGSFSKDERLRPREMVAGLAVGSETMAFPIAALRTTRVVNDRLGGIPIVVIHQPSSDTTTAFEATANGKTLTFRAANVDASAVIDRTTGTTWDAYGLAVKGPLKGTRLKPLILIPEFWFAWSQFRPGTRLFTGDGTR